MLETCEGPHRVGSSWLSVLTDSEEGPGLGSRSLLITWGSWLSRVLQAAKFFF